MTETTDTDFRSWLRGLGACTEAVNWVGDRDAARAWSECERGDWMLWAAAKVGVDRRQIVLAACDCAEMSLTHVDADERRPAEAIVVSRRWASGDPSVTLDDVQSADAAAAASADAAAAYSAAAAYAAYAAAYAADAATYAAYAATYAASADTAAAAAAVVAAAAADTAAAAADAAAAVYAADDARKTALRDCADIVRQRIPVNVIEEASGRVVR